MADSYNYDMQRLQQDAIRRAREMQARAQSYAAQQQPAPPPPPPEPQRHIPPAEPRHTPPREHAPQGNREQPKNQLNPIGSIFEGLMKDSERTLIIVLILLLVEEKANPEIIFALLYLVL
jgi:hypothetical protein